MLKRDEIIDFMRLANPLNGDYETTDAKNMQLSIIPIKGGHVKAAVITKTTQAYGKNNPHTAQVGFDGKNWYIGCGNSFLEAKISKKEANLAVKKVTNSSVEAVKLLNTWGSVPKNTGCHFWHTWNGKRNVCKHIDDLLADVSPQELLDLEEMMGLETAMATEVTEINSEDYTDPIAAKMQAYGLNGRQRHLLLVGPKGNGKTKTIYDQIDRDGYDHVYLGGDADKEALDLVGTLLPIEKDGNKEFIWVDGPLSQAFRKAQSGVKTILFIDELLRMSGSALSSLVATLTTDNKGNYVLNTGRVINVVDGVGHTEILRAPRENLWVLATTNIGAGYDVTALDDALEDRFEIIDLENEFDKISAILLDVATDKGISADIAVKLMSFYKKMEKLIESEKLEKVINLRHLVQIIEDCKTDKDLYECTLDRMPKWVARDTKGKLIKEQIKIVETAMEKSDIVPSTVSKKTEEPTSVKFEDAPLPF
jgi:DNA polymerase III delta prime subunit